jgi:preprotein translocase subunit SecG
MTFKTIFIIIVSVLVTIILMNNTDEINFWLFGNTRIPKLAILGLMFGLGLILGFIAGRPGKNSRKNLINHSETAHNNNMEAVENERDTLSDEDREYIK